MSRSRPLRVAVLISGGGSTLENLLARLRNGRLHGVRLPLVISSRRAVRGVDVARAAGVPLVIIRRRDCADDAEFSRAITAALDAAEIELVLLAGFLCFWEVPPHYLGRVLNIHPALLPKFGGKGFYGEHVHAAVLAAGERESGCTVHVVTNEYDRGPIVAQERVQVLPTDTPHTLAERVMARERELYPRIVQKVADEGLEWLGRLVQESPVDRGGPDAAR